MKKILLARLACACLAISLTGCGASSNTVVTADLAVLTNVFSVGSLYGILHALPVDGERQKEIGTATLSDYFSGLMQKCSDDTLELNGKKVAGVATRLKALQSHIRGVSASYASLNAMYTAFGNKEAASWSADDVSNLAESLEQTATDLGLASTAAGEVATSKTPGSAWFNLHAIDLLRAVSLATSGGRAGLALYGDEDDDEGYWDGQWPPAPTIGKPKGQVKEGSIPASPYTSPKQQARPPIEGAGLKWLPYS